MESCCSRFTAAEGGARLAAAAGVKNIMITEHTNFIPTSLLIEYAHRIRGSLESGFQRSIYITRASKIDCIAHELKILTDLVISGVKGYDDVQDWRRELEEKQVIVCTSLVLKQILENEMLDMLKINVLIVDSCHLVFKDDNLKYIMKLYKNCDENKRPRILAMTYPLFQSSKDNEEAENIDNEQSNEKYENNEIDNNTASNENNEIDNDTPKDEREINDNNDLSKNDGVNEKHTNECVNNEMNQVTDQSNDIIKASDGEISENDVNVAIDNKSSDNLQEDSKNTENHENEADLEVQEIVATQNDDTTINEMESTANPENIENNTK
ncbi:unnamed protein product [Colias eurytheme]|nr:unnamed protein product [Colias eurytheme]